MNTLQLTDRLDSEMLVTLGGTGGLNWHKLAPAFHNGAPDRSPCALFPILAMDRIKFGEVASGHRLR